MGENVPEHFPLKDCLLHQSVEICFPDSFFTWYYHVLGSIPVSHHFSCSKLPSHSPLIFAFHAPTTPLFTQRAVVSGGRPLGRRQRERRGSSEFGNEPGSQDTEQHQRGTWGAFTGKDPWCWNIYLLTGIILNYILGVNVGKYSSTMDPLGMTKWRMEKRGFSVAILDSNGFWLDFHGI